jgi:hypothetical protein
MDDTTSAKKLLRADKKILNLFDSCRKSIQLPPKKEYVRCKLIRGHKRAIRQIIQNQIPKTTVHKFSETDDKAQSLWHIIKQLYENHPEEFDDISKTESGPITDGKTKREDNEFKRTEKSFNSRFCEEYFRSMNVRESFSVYLELIFCHFDPEVLSEKFEFSCCRMEKHSVECLEKWLFLKDYLKDDMIKEVRCEPVDFSSFLLDLVDFEKLSDFEDYLVHF